ncbi:MAG: RNA 3'-terminal phosphate cyclase [Planctomycetes bacterium]|nr:RNA 3'-terminal phosphate cyclase [Planctomycetota bacterium]
MSAGGGPVELDGSEGEGGGQILRTGLSLSVLTGRPLHIRRIRAGREKPGLRPQHLACVRAAARVSGAAVHGDGVGSCELRFDPGPLRPGAYLIDIGTAGATSLVVQTLAYPLALASTAPFDVRIVGGTHVPTSPAYHWLERQWLPWMKKLGFALDLRLEEAGFYPRGGGRISLDVRPSRPLAGLVLGERGRLRRVHGLSMIARLPLEIAERQRDQAERGLRLLRLGPDVSTRVEVLPVAGAGPGTMLLLLAEHENGVGCFAALGARGKRAERVADEAVEALARYEARGACLDAHLADQLLLPLALAPTPSSFTTEDVTLHLLTQAEVVQRFLPAKIHVEGEVGQPGTVHVEPAPGVAPSA